MNGDQRLDEQELIEISVKAGFKQGFKAGYTTGYEKGKSSQKSVFDKIRAEIKNIEYLSCPQPYVVLNDVLEIIDKCKAENEGEE